MDSIKIFWGDDKNFEDAVSYLDDTLFLVDIVNHINKTDLKIEGAGTRQDPPMEVENLLIHTDDYGGIREWALLGFSNNILQNLKVKIKNLWLCNPPQKIYQDILKNYDKAIISETPTIYPTITIDDMRRLSENFSSEVIGQPHVMKQALSSIYSLNKKERKRPVTLLFLGDSGIGKTETAKFISNCLNTEMVRIQFSMQQTTNAYQYIFGADHGEDSLARELIRRKSNIILLDEFDKVPPSFYNAFYQMFDEGYFVDSNYSVDVSNCIIICTTNYRSEEDAEKYLGTPIYSRFSKVIIFNPISINDKIQIAEKCYNSILENLSDEDKSLVSDNKVLPLFQESIRKGAYPNMRMLKNDIEDALNIEILKARQII